MTSTSVVDTALAFVEKINRRDFAGLRTLMADNFVGTDEAGSVTRGRSECAKVIEQYAINSPGFRIQIAEVYLKGGVVSIAGVATGSCGNGDRGFETGRRLLYQIEVDGGVAKSFRYAVPDSRVNRFALGFAESERITE